MIDASRPVEAEECPHRDQEVQAKCRRHCCWSEPARAASSWRATATAATGRLRGPYCEGWPIYHAIFDPAEGSIYAAGASEWHGSAVWRSPDLGESWSLSSEGISYEDGGRKLSKISSLAATPGRILAGVEAPGIFESRDGGSTWGLLSTLAGEPGSEGWDDPANQPPGHLGLSALMFDGDDDSRFWAIVQGDRPVRDERQRQLVGAAQQGAPRRLAPRARGGRLLRPQARAVRRRP